MYKKFMQFQFSSHFIQHYATLLFIRSTFISNYFMQQQ